MAKVAISKKLTTKPKANKPRVTRTAAKSIDDKYYGLEPLDVSKRGMIDALNWYNYMFEHDNTRDWMFDYLKKNEFNKSDIAAVKRLPKFRLTKTTCIIARIISNGNTLPVDYQTRFDQTIKTLILEGNMVKEAVKEDTTEKVTVSIQDRTRAKIHNLITDCEEAIDVDPYLNIYDWLKGKEATSQAATAIRDFYQLTVNDLSVADEHETRAEVKMREQSLKQWVQFIYDCDRFIGNKKVTKFRKPREKKTKSAVDQVQKLKFQKEFPPLKIVSVNPGEIIGASQLWTYNTKYKKLTRYDASGPGGIQVKGTTLIGFDVEKSITKSVRKPEDTIEKVLKAGKVTLRTVLEDIKTNTSSPNGRINSDTIILRVIK